LNSSWKATGNNPASDTNPPIVSYRHSAPATVQWNTNSSRAESSDLTNFINCASSIPYVTLKLANFQSRSHYYLSFSIPTTIDTNPQIVTVIPRLQKFNEYKLIPSGIPLSYNFINCASSIPCVTANLQSLPLSPLTANSFIGIQTENQSYSLQLSAKSLIDCSIPKHL